MATKTFYVINNPAIAPGYFGQLQEDGSAPADANASFGFSPGKLVINAFCRARLGANNTSGTVSARSYIATATGPVKGSGSTKNTAGDSFITPNAYDGDFASGNWAFSIPMRAGVEGLAGRLVFRVWASINANGSAARELTTGGVKNTSVDTFSASANSTLTLTWAAPAISLANEYLFFQCEYQEQTAVGVRANDSVFFRVGGSITTTNFTSNQALSVDGGSYALVGTDAVLASSVKLDATTGGSYSLAGALVRLLVTPFIAVDPGSYALTGAATTLLKVGKKVAAGTSSYALSGANATLKEGRTLTAPGGTYLLTGADATLAFINKQLIADAGAFSLIGSSVNLTIVSAADVAAATLQFPSAIDQIVMADNYTETMETNLIEFKPEVGPPKLRRHMSVSQDLITFTMWLSSDDWDTLKDFYRDDLKDGTLEFVWRHPRTDATVDYKFEGGPPILVSVFELTYVIQFTLRLV